MLLCSVARPACAVGQEPAATDTARGKSPTVNECATRHREWIWCDDFEQDRLQQYFEYEDASGRFTRAAGVGVKGSFGMRARFTPGETSAGALHLAIGKVPAKYFRPVDAGTTAYRELYWRLYVRYQPGWIGGVGYKLTRAMSFTNASWAEAMVAHVWGGDAPDTNYLQLDPVSGWGRSAAPPLWGTPLTWASGIASRSIPGLTILHRPTACSSTGSTGTCRRARTR